MNKSAAKPKGKPGRPKLTEEEKAARAAAKMAGEKQAAPGLKKAEAKKEAASHPKRFNSAVDEESRALFLNTLPKIADLKAKLNTANANLRNAYKSAKRDGFLKSDFEIAFQIQQAEGEKAKKAAIARDLTIAKWLGADLGAQLDLFVQDERVPAADRAYEEGKVASMQGEAAKPGYDPSTEQYRQYMAGYHDETERRVKKGIETLPPEVAEDEKRKAAAKAKSEKQKAEDAEAFEDGVDGDTGADPEPTSGVPMTRSQFRAQQEQAAANGGAAPSSALFNKRT